MFDWIQIAGWLGAAGQMYGAWLVSRKNRKCWYYWLASNVFCLIYAITLCLWPIIVIQVYFVVINILGIREWRKGDKK